MVNMDNAINIIFCVKEKCLLEKTNVAKINVERDKKINILWKDYKDNKISKKEFNIKATKINGDYEKTKQNYKLVKCKIDKCYDLYKLNLFITIDNLIKKSKSKKNREKLLYYKNLFTTKIELNDVKNFINEFK